VESAPLGLHHFFAEQVRTAFAFLEVDYGFRLVEVKHGSAWGVNISVVRYESDRVFVVLDFGDKVPELYESLGLLDEGLDSRFSLDQVQEVQGIRVVRGLSPEVARNERQVIARVSALAETTKQCAYAALSGDMAFYLRLHDLTAADTNRVSNPKRRAAYARQRIQQARDAGDWRAIALRYGWLEDKELTDDERREKAEARRRFVDADF
jgi:hypothetical protein